MKAGKFRRLVTLCLIILVAIMCAMPFILFWGFPRIYEWQIWQLIDVPENAKFISEERVWYGSNSTLVSTYFWSNDAPYMVESYFSNVQFFPSEDEYGNWIIGLYPEPTIKNISTIAPQYGTHYSLCKEEIQDICISIALIDKNQIDYYLTGVSSPSIFRRQSIPSEFSGLPSYGTLIIYSYYVYTA